MRFLHSLLFLLTISALCTPTAAGADESKVNKKFGKPTMEEMKMTVYDADPDANAVILYKEGYGRFSYDDRKGTFSVIYEFMTRIKVLRREGTEYADVEIPFYDNGVAGDMKDNLTGIKACSFNLVDGKIKKTELEKKMIFTENIYEGHHVKKFSIPNVKEGSVIEYKYQINTTRIPYLRSWYPQARIPSVYSEFEMKIPSYFRFNISVKGYEQISVEKEKTFEQFRIMQGAYGNSVSCPADKIIITADSLPALKDDEFTFGINDYITHVDFEMAGLDFPGQTYKSFSNTWEDVDNTILKNGMEEALGMKNPFPDMMDSVNSQTSAIGKAIAAATAVRKRIKWDGRYRLFVPDFKKEVQNSSGSNAAINLAVMSMMRDAGITCYPVVLRLRSNGILPQMFPSFDKIDTFVIGFKDEKGAWHYLDGSDPVYTVDVLPVDMLVEAARIVGKDYTGKKWVALDNLCKNVSRSMISATIDDSFNIRCEERETLSGQTAAQFKKEYAQAADSLSFVSELSAKQDITLASLLIEKSDNDRQVDITAVYEKPAAATDSLIYIVPTITPQITENPFTQESRKLPVIYPYRQEHITSVTLDIPEGYEIEELPKELMAETAKRELVYSFNPVVLGNQIIITTKLTRNAMLFSPEQYGMLKQVYSYITDKNNEMIVLRKKKSE